MFKRFLFMINVQRFFLMFFLKRFFYYFVFSAPSDRRETNHGLLESPRGVDSNGGGFALLGSVDVEIFGKTLIGAVKKYGLLTFSRHPVIVETRNTARWNRHVET